MMPGWFELLILFGVILLFFGASRLPNIAKSMGLSIGKFKEGLEEGKQNPDSLEDQEMKESSKEESTDSSSENS